MNEKKQIISKMNGIGNLENIGDNSSLSLSSQGNH